MSIPWGPLVRALSLMLLTACMNECTKNNRRTEKTPRYWEGISDPARDTVYYYLDSVYNAELERDTIFKP